ncbi:uncharacterized protein FOMMEDRAFT_171291 [Fomitiporia mediterranea MF3/22]|uniref:uncharacterized protein n=1 Tax=Fomitiporia mediterranea (strain MF3/22) TaxID=694068 RepID=UPI00044080F3|nr:uncharacterized protein FOMMEDRAFT_171291 [Fomitiporia mediterranea MF3/22]EJC97881.1 hypothetical protein FOMMEDRAFT_171291 [Fomitiporia mediterranea MF3/22]
MEMTYTALAKSLGIPLKSTSSSTSTTSMSPVSTSVQALASISTASTSAKVEQDKDSKDVVMHEEEERNYEGEKEDKPEKVETTSKPLPPARKDSTPPHVETMQDSKADGGDEMDMDVESDADADGELDAEGESDIASSRPSPGPIPPLDSSQEGNLIESQTTQATSVSQSSDADVVVDSADAQSKPQPVDRELMTDTQLDQAKVLVLDLLGWGVPPEYLLQRGISHALLYTVFTDLRLRLPDSIIEDCNRLVAAQS